MVRLAELLQQFKARDQWYMLCLHCNADDLRDDAEALFIKGVFHTLIVDDKHTDLIPVYAQFWPNIYEGMPFEIFCVDIPSNLIEIQNAKYAASLARIEQRRVLADKSAYRAREIVIVRDKLNTWLLARVLAVFTYDGRSVWHVEFLEYPSIANEIIVDPLRIKKYRMPKFKQVKTAETPPDLQQGHACDPASI
jgi:hypothetical protein